MFFAKLFTGKIGELLAPSPKPKEEFHSFLKVSLMIILVLIYFLYSLFKFN